MFNVESRIKLEPWGHAVPYIALDGSLCLLGPLAESHKPDDTYLAEYIPRNGKEDKGKLLGID